jgi:hypothetical protein
MTVLELMRDVCNQLGLAEPSLVVGSTNKLIKQLTSMLESDVSEELKSQVRWPQLTRSWVITLVDGQASYNMPGDLDWTINETQWKSGSYEVVDGPYEAAEWEAMENGHSSPVVTPRFKVEGIDPTQLTLSPTPTANEAGQTLSFKYQTTSWIRPQLWVATDTYAPGEYVYSAGRIYTTPTGGTAGTDAPTHQVGVESDGSVNWEFMSGGYTRFMSDADEFLLPHYICSLALKYNWTFSKGQPYQKHEARFKQELSRQRTKLSGSRAVILSGGNRRLQTVRDAADRMY